MKAEKVMLSAWCGESDEEEEAVDGMGAMRHLIPFGSGGI